MKVCAEQTGTPFRRRHRLAGQSVAFGIMIAAPVEMYLAAEAGAVGWLLAGLGAMAVSMVLAMWSS